MEYAIENFGSGNVTRQQIMQPAIDLATQGYLVSTYQSQQITDHYADMTGDYPVLGSYYLREDGLPYQNGDVLRNPDLAKSLTLIAEQGKTTACCCSASRLPPCLSLRPASAAAAASKPAPWAWSLWSLRRTSPTRTSLR